MKAGQRQQESSPRRGSRRKFLKEVAGAVGAWALTRRREFASSAKPANVLILMSDEHNPFYSSPYGDPYRSGVKTPNMARLARMGTVFENAYCPSPLCAPARSAFVSGRWVHEIQAYNNCSVFEFDYPTYGGVLREQGVYTVHAGKTDVYNRASTLGFAKTILPGDRALPGDTEISRHPLAIRHGEGTQRGRGYGVKAGNPFAGDDRVVAGAEEWLTTEAPKLRQPWTLAVNIIKPHFPEFVTQELWDKYPQGGDLPRYGPEQASAQHPFALALRRHFETADISETATRGLRRGYLGCVTEVDRQLGRLLDTLERTRLIENAVVAYTSDHGEMLGKFGMWWKCSLYEDSARVPLIVAGAGFTPGARVKTPVSTLDLQAAIFNAVGANRPANWQGSPLQTIRADDLDRVLFCEYHGHGAPASCYLLRKGVWKLIYYVGAPRQLFNLEMDPNELRNLAGEYPGKVSELEQDLRRICSPEMENQRAEDFIQKQLKAIHEGGFSK
jgi:choline-sulfatase